MELGKVVGSVWATKKEESLNGEKLLIVQEIKANEEEKENLTVATDMIGAGVGDIVLVVFGGSARYASGNADNPVDAAIVGIVDSIEVEDKS